MSRGPVVWTPDADAAAGSQLARYMRWLADEGGRELASYEELWAWSVDDLEGFWASVWRYFDIQATPYDAVLGDREMPGARWFAGARLNYAEHALRAGAGDRVAVVEHDEEGPRGELTWDELRAAVGGAAAGLRERGIGRGDLVVGYLPNCAEAVIAYLACASIGAVWSSCAPGPAAVRRAGPLRPAAPGGAHRLRRLPLRRARPRPARGGGRARRRAATPARPGGHRRPARASAGRRAPSRGRRWRGRRREPAFEPLPFDHPLYVLFSSGTTGPPKGIVHGHGGQLLDHVRHHALHLDLGPADRFSFYTGTGWMVWNWLVAGLLVGSTIVLYDGSPRHPELDAQFEVVARAGATVHGTSAGYLTACAKAGLSPGARHDLGALRAIASTGSPLPPETFHWIHDAVGEHVWPVSTSGGTDVCSAFVSGCPLLPVRAGEIQCRCLGAAIDVLRRGRPAAARRGRRARPHRAAALDARALLGRPRRRALPRELLRRLPRHLAPRRLGDAHRRRRGRHPRPLGLDPQPPRRAHRHGRDLRRGRSPARGGRQPGHRRRAARRGLLDGALRRPRRRRGPRRRRARRDRRGDPHRGLAAPRARRDRAGARRSRAR